MKQNINQNSNKLININFTYFDNSYIKLNDNFYCFLVRFQKNKI